MIWSFQYQPIIMLHNFPSIPVGFYFDLIRIYTLLGKSELHNHIINVIIVDDLGPLLLTWFNFDPSMDK